jgi:hypothetical protein
LGTVKPHCVASTQAPSSLVGSAQDQNLKVAKPATLLNKIRLLSVAMRAENGNLIEIRSPRHDSN